MCKAASPYKAVILLCHTIAVLRGPLLQLSKHVEKDERVRTVARNT